MRDTEVISDYQKGVCLTDIATKHGICQGTVFNILKRHNIQTHRNRQQKRDTGKDAEIIRRYCNLQSVWSISKEMGISVYKVTRALKEVGLFGTITQAKRLNPLFYEDYFHEIDTPEKAYWLGWLLTDGTVSEDGDIALTLISSDLHILQLFERDLGIEGKVKPFNESYFRFMFGSKRMCSDLSRYGVIPNKTKTVSLPSVPISLLPHLLRGCFDGDGGLTLSQRKGKPTIELSFTKNESFVRAFNEAISLISGIPPKNVTANHSIKRVRWSNIDEVKTILGLFYANSGEHRLTRKYEIYQQILLL